MDKSTSTISEKQKTASISDFKPLEATNTSIENRSIGKSYKFLTRRKNPNYEKGIKAIKVGSKLKQRVSVKIDRIEAKNKAINILRSDTCLLHHNSHSNLPKKVPQIYRSIANGTIYVKTEPKWTTDLLETLYDTETGEQLEQGIYSTNEFKSQTGRKIHSLNEFFNFYESYKRKREVQMYFLTFTLASHSRLLWSEMLHNVKARYKAKGYTIRGYIWTAEIGEEGKEYKDTKGNNRITTNQWHYHLIISVTQKHHFKNIPKWTFFEDLWGARTQCEWVKSDGLKMYLAKYLSKCNYKVVNTRSKGRSIEYL